MSRATDELGKKAVEPARESERERGSGMDRVLAGKRSSRESKEEKGSTGLSSKARAWKLKIVPDRALEGQEKGKREGEWRETAVPPSTTKRCYQPLLLSRLLLLIPLPMLLLLMLLMLLMLMLLLILLLCHLSPSPSPSPPSSPSPSPSPSALTLLPLDCLPLRLLHSTSCRFSPSSPTLVIPLPPLTRPACTHTRSRSCFLLLTRTRSV